MKQKKKLSTLLIGLVLLLVIFAIFPTVQATDFHVIKGTLFIDDEVADSGIEIILDIPEKEFTTTITTTDPNPYNFYAGFDDETYGGTTVFFTIVYNGQSYEPIDNVSIILDNETGNPIAEYFMDLHVDTSEPANNPPNTPSNPSPGNSATGVSISADISWSGGDPDGDTVTYDIYFGTSSSPPLVKSGRTSTTYDVGTMSYLTTYYWQIVAEDEHGLTVTGSIWSFTTKEEETSGGGGGGSPPPSNPPPTADAGGPYVGVVGELITFDGSASTDDGEVVGYRWDFDNDGNYDTDWSDTATAKHSYSSVGEFTVKLQVKDNEDATDNDTATVSISKFNNPPTKPQIGGPKTGSKNNNYEYSAVSTDADDDTIEYNFYWGDGTNSSTGFTENGTQVTKSHSWSAYGFYIITVEAYDGETITSSDGYEVAIDVMRVKDIGFLIDSDSDGTFESFSSKFGAITDTEKQEDGTYLINNDEDNDFDWRYDPDTDTLTEYTPPSGGNNAEKQDYTLWYALIIIVIILVLLGLVAKSRKKPEQKQKTKKK